MKKTSMYCFCRGVMVKVIAVMTIIPHSFMVLCEAEARPLNIQYELITFDDIKPKGAHLKSIWCGIGIDNYQRVYIAICGQDSLNYDDTHLVRYYVDSGSREYLGSLRSITKNLDNLGPNEHWPTQERIGKVHTELLEHEGKIYYATQDHYTWEEHWDYKLRNVKSNKHRGAHFYSYDLKTGEFDDLSKSDGLGVSAPYQGIVALNVLKNMDQLVGFSYPGGDLVIYDLNSKMSSIYQGPKEYRTRQMSRVILATITNKIYFSYHSEDFWLWVYDPVTSEMKRTNKPNILKNGYLKGMAEKKDGSIVYLQSMNGLLYAFHVMEERIENLGSLLTNEEVGNGCSVERVMGLVLSKDENKLYSLPYKVSNGTPCGLYEYDIATGEKEKIANLYTELGDCVITGSGVVDDNGCIYYGYHTKDQIKDVKAGLLKIDVSSRMEIQASSGQ